MVNYIVCLSKDKRYLYLKSYDDTKLRSKENPNGIRLRGDIILPGEKLVTGMNTDKCAIIATARYAYPNALLADMSENVITETQIPEYITDYILYLIFLAAENN